MAGKDTDIANVTVFGSEDRKGKTSDGRISSSYPGWYFDNQIAELKERVAKQERALKTGRVPAESIPAAQTQLNVDREKLGKIEQSRPRLTGKERAWVAKEVAILEAKIKETMFSESEMKLGGASPHEEARRMIDPIIPVDKKVAELCGLKVIGGKTSRNNAIRAWKILRKMLGEPTNTVYLTHDEITCRTRKINPFTGIDDEEDDGREVALEGAQGPA